MENGSINNIESSSVEQNSVNSHERNRPVNRLLRFLMSAGVIAALAGFIYALFWFMNNSGV
ncbi:MAG: hypothetical protein IJE48_07995 [Clostridia bacterium]|nr:hypothetical protein [Clostridia bacterium]